MDLYVLKLPKLIAERRSSAIFGVLIIAMLWLDLQLHALAALALTLIVLAAMERILRPEARARQKAEQLQRTLENISQGIMLVTKDQQLRSSTGAAANSLVCRQSSSSSRPSYGPAGRIPNRNGRGLPRARRTGSGCTAVSGVPAS